MFIGYQVINLVVFKGGQDCWLFMFFIGSGNLWVVVLVDIIVGDYVVDFVVYYVVLCINKLFEDFFNVVVGGQFIYLCLIDKVVFKDWILCVQWINVDKNYVCFLGDVGDVVE